MSIKNPTDFLVQATRLPAAIEGKLPAGAPKISAMLLNVAGKLPKVPDLLVTFPDLPEPKLPALPGAGAPAPTWLRYVTEVRVAPAIAVRPQAEKIPLVFE